MVFTLSVAANKEGALATGQKNWLAIPSALACAAMLVPASSLLAEEPVAPKRPGYNMFGITGGIDTPSADMQPDGQLGLTTSYFSGFSRNTLTAQIMPGIEAAFRYSVLHDFRNASFADRTLFDRSFDIKARILEEGSTWPSIAIGLQDFLGTGIYSGEYIVATKGLNAGDYGNFRLSGGLGWGRFASGSDLKNPLINLSKRFETRSGSAAGGGQVNVGQFFQGEHIGVFGGLVWDTPIAGLAVKMDYSQDDYFSEKRGGSFEQKIPLNFGVEYSGIEGMELGAYYMYGNAFGVRLTLTANPFYPPSGIDSEPGPQALLPRAPVPDATERTGLGTVVNAVDRTPATASTSDRRLRSARLHERLGTVRWVEAVVDMRSRDRCPTELARALDADFGVVDAVTFTTEAGAVLCTVALRPEGERAIRLTSRVTDAYPTDWHADEGLRKEIVETLTEELAADSIGLMGIDIAPRRTAVYIENKRFFAMPRAFGRTARAMARALPPSVEVFEIVPIEDSLPVATITLTRSDLEDQVERPDADIASYNTATISDAPRVDWDETLIEDGLFPRFNWSILPDVPMNLFDPDQPIRLDLQLVAEGSVEFWPGLSGTAQIRKRIIGDLDDIERGPGSSLPNVRSDIARYLREGDPALTRMTFDYVDKISKDTYGRVSVGLLELMYAGVSGEVLWKPATQSWGLGAELNYARQRDYDARFSLLDYDVVTGHASFYWDTDFYDLSTQVDVGRYLAGDWGGTLAVKRRFDNGWEVGAFATLTDVPFDEFGEGSFDKGLFLTIPFNWITPFDTRQTVSTTLRPLTRDGGQRLNVSNRLYDTVEDNDVGGYRATWKDFWE